VDKLTEKTDLHDGWRHGGYIGLMFSFPREVARHHAGPSGQTLIQQTSSPSAQMNGSRLRWSIPL